MADIVKTNNQVATVEKHIPQVGDYYTDRDGMILIRDITHRTVNGNTFTFYVCSEINEHFEPYESTDEKTLDTLNEHYKYLPDARKHWDDAEKLLNGELVLDIADGERDYTVVNTYAVVEGGNLKLLQSQKQALSDANERAEHILAAARTKIEIVQARMEHERRKLEKYKGGIMKQIERINNVLGLLDLYTTDGNDINHIKEGAPASENEPLYIRQLTLYMDEECAIADNEGIDANDIPQFTEWLLSDQKHIDQLVPEQRVVVAIKPRRGAGKHYDDARYKEQVERWNKYTYFLFRNGENLYYIDSQEFQVRENLVPTKKELDKVQQSAKDAERWGRSAQEVYEQFNLQYYRFMMFLQGIIVNTHILDPIPKTINMLDESTYEDYIKVVYDAEDLLTDGHKTYNEWKALNRASVTVGSRIIYSAHLTESWDRRVSRHERWGNEHILRYYNGDFNMPSLPETGVYDVKAVKYDLHYKRDELLYTGEGKGEVLGFLYEYHKEFEYLDAEKKHRRITCLINNDDIYLNYNMLSLEDIEYYLNSRIYRPQYLEIMPILLQARKELREEKRQEDAFRDLLIHHSSKPLTPDVVDEAIDWWKMKNKYKRPISKDCTKAMRMIKQRLGVK